MPHSEQRHRPPPKALILRVYVDDAGMLRGRVDDPANETRTPFAGTDELLELIFALTVQPDPPERTETCG